MGYFIMVLLLLFFAAIGLVLPLTAMWLDAQLRIVGYATFTLGPLWVMILPGYIAVSW
jgi:hypothetical protein